MNCALHSVTSGLEISLSPCPADIFKRCLQHRICLYQCHLEDTDMGRNAHGKRYSANRNLELHGIPVPPFLRDPLFSPLLLTIRRFLKKTVINDSF